ncbi:DUF4160 domain-containing protein [Cylindrospermopsis raciborskii]|uniref:DUF4160 domain-containing protein n=1 Tax=Cylindrospermopsis raciborskii TaxID=77022 RepID=UPI001C63EE0F|nr:DUF4160 domain-containing protein [Cylindrospermopsis raciborskii]
MTIRNQIHAGNYQILRNGIIIKLFFADYPPAHFHAIYGEYNAIFNLETLEFIEGDLPNRAIKMVVEWASLYQGELLKMWKDQEFSKLPPLK